MRCLKCGDKTQSQQVFCQKCLAQMAKYPVDKDAVPALPSRIKTNVKKKRPPKPEEVIADLQKANRIQRKNIHTLQWTLLLILITVGLLVWYGISNGYIQSINVPDIPWSKPHG